MKMKKHGKNNDLSGQEGASLSAEDPCQRHHDDLFEEKIVRAGVVAEARLARSSAKVLSQVCLGLGLADREPTEEQQSEEQQDDEEQNEPALPIELGLLYAEVQEKLGFAKGPTKLGRYQIRSRLDSGGMGVVYRAWDEIAARDVALKRLHYVADPESAEAEQRAEVQAMAALRHENVVAVYDLCEVGSDRVIVMEYVEGRTLRDWIDLAFWGLDELLAVFEAIARGLQAIHEAGFFHGDLKLDNVMIDRDDRPRIVDLGMAARVEQEPLGGTLEYMPNELLQGLDDRPQASVRKTVPMKLADQYSFCVMLFWALAERHPYVGEDEFAATLRRSGITSWDEVRRQYRTRLCESQRERAIRWPDPRIRRVPRWLRRLLARGLATDPDDRFESMAVVLEALQHPQRASRWRRRGAFAGVGLTLGVGLMGVFFKATAPEPCGDVGAALDGIWNESTRRRVEAKDRNAPKLFDAYSARWRSVQKDTCESAFLRHEVSEAELEARYACLDRRGQELGALVKATAEGTFSAFRASSLLRDPEPCGIVDGSIDRLTDGASDPRESLRQKVREAEIRGDFADGRALAGDALEEAQSSGFFALQAEALLERARLGLLEVTLVSDDDEVRAQSERDLREAIAIAGDLGDRALLFEGRIFAARIAAARGDQIDASGSLLAQGKRMGPGLGRQLDDLQGLIKYREALASEEDQEKEKEKEKEKLLGEARRFYKKAIEGHQKAGDQYAEAKAWENFGDVLGQSEDSKDQESAEIAYKRASDLWRNAGGFVPALGTLLARRINLTGDEELCTEADRWLAGASLAPASRRRVDGQIGLACANLEWPGDLTRAQGYARRALVGTFPRSQRFTVLILAAEITNENPEASASEIQEALERLAQAEKIFAGLSPRLRQEQASNEEELVKTRESLQRRAAEAERAESGENSTKVDDR